MIQMPVVIGLTFCESVSWEKDDGLCFNGVLNHFVFSRFPARRVFKVLFWLTDGVGEGKMNIKVNELSGKTEACLYSQDKWLALPDDRTLIVFQELTIRKCVFPHAGRFELVVSLDGQWLASRSFLCIRDRL